MARVAQEPTAGTRAGISRVGPEKGQKKAALKGGFFVFDYSRSNSQCLDPFVQAVLVTRGLILGHNAFVDHAVDHWNGVFVGSCSSVLVPGITGLDDVLDFGAHKRTHTHIVLTGLFTLAGALSC